MSKKSGHAKQAGGLNEPDRRREGLSAYECAGSDSSPALDKSDMLTQEIELFCEEDDAALLMDAIDRRLTELGIADTEEDAERRQARWDQFIVEKREKPATRPVGVVRWVRLLAAAVFCMVCLATTTVSVGYALNWQFLMRVLQPVAETLGIRLNLEDSTGAELKKELPKESAKYDGEAVIIRDKESVPAFNDGYPITLQWVPAGYEFRMFSRFGGAYSSVYGTQYSDGKNEILFYVHTYTEYETIASIQAELERDRTESLFISNREITIAQNGDLMTASWTDDLAFFRVSGIVDVGDLVKVIESIYGG